MDKKGKREYLNDKLTGEFTFKLNEYFGAKVNVSRVNIKSKYQELESLINEEAMLLAKYVRNEKKEWIPRIPKLQ